MDATDRSRDALKYISCDDFKFEVKNESFEDWSDSSSNKAQGYSSLSLEVKKMSSNSRDADLKNEKSPTTNLTINSGPSSNSEVIQPERNDFLQVDEALNSEEGETEHASFNILEIKPTLEDKINDNVHIMNSLGILMGHISGKLNRNSKQVTDNKASGKSRKSSDKEKNKIKKSHSPRLNSKIRNEETYGVKHKSASAITEKNQEGCNLTVSSRAQKLRFDPWEEVSCNRENHARKVHLSYDRNTTTMRTYLSNNQNTDKKSKDSSKNDSCKAYSSDQSNSDKNYYSETNKTFNPFHKEEAREDEQYVPHFKKIYNVEENKSKMKDTFRYKGKNCLENPSVLDDKNLSQKPNVGHNDDKLNHASCTDKEVVMSCDIYKESVNSKTAFVLDDIRKVNTSNKENREEKSKNECGDIREVRTSNKGNKGKISGPPSPLIENTKVTNDYGKKDEVLHVNNQQVLLMPLNKNNFENTEIEETTGVERVQPGVPVLSDAQRKNINENPSETLFETPNSVEVINVEEDQQEECYSCSRCSFTATNKVSLRQHLFTHLNGNLSRNPLGDMHRVIGNPIRHHPRKQSSKKSSGLKCYLCGYECIRKNKLEKHIYKNHFSKKIYRCYACSYESSNMSLLRRHSETHFENDSLSVTNCHRCPCDNLRELREMSSQKRAFSYVEDHNRNKRGKFDYLQGEKLENILMGFDKLMNKMNDNITLLTQAISLQVNELGAVVSGLKTDMSTTFDTSVLRDSPTIQPSTSKRQQRPISRYMCVNCEPQPSTSGTLARNSFRNLFGVGGRTFSYDNSSTK